MAKVKVRVKRMGRKKPPVAIVARAHRGKGPKRGKKK